MYIATLTRSGQEWASNVVQYQRVRQNEKGRQSKDSVGLTFRCRKAAVPEDMCILARQFSTGLTQTGPSRDLCEIREWLKLMMNEGTVHHFCNGLIGVKQPSRRPTFP